MKTWKTGTLAVVAAASLVACGGGGGGGGDGGTGTGTGLVPAAPTPGATLLADAAVLRPLTATRQWSYRGSEVLTPGGSPRSYATTTTQTGVTATQATENSSNGSNEGPSTSTLRVEAGEVSTTEDLDLTGTGVPGTTRTIELRSPVRVDDQVVSLDQRITATGLDADSDGREDLLDVAIWSRVVGRETVALADAGATQVDAVRVDTRLVVRIVLASTGAVYGTATGSVSTWYAEGTGIVRQTFKAEEDVTGSSSSATEVLTSFAPLASAGVSPQAAVARPGVLQRLVGSLRAAALRR